MPTEEEKRLHRCCFSGHRPEKLNVSEADVKNWLNEQIDEAIADGYKTFITGCAMGVDIWAGQIVLQKKEQNPDLHLIAATPWPGFASRWSNDWQRQYNDLIHKADWVVNVSDHYDDGVFTKRNNWMCDHSNRVIAFYNGAPGGTRNMLAYAETKQIEIVTNNPEYTPVEKQKRERKESNAEKVGKLTPGRYLLTATGHMANTDAVIKEVADKKITTGSKQGGSSGYAPVLCEGIPAELTLRGLDANSIEAYALDASGTRGKRLDVANTPEGACLSIGPEYRALWYEIVVK